MAFVHQTPAASDAALCGVGAPGLFFRKADRRSRIAATGDYHRRIAARLDRDYARLPAARTLMILQRALKRQKQLLSQFCRGKELSPRCYGTIRRWRLYFHRILKAGLVVYDCMDELVRLPGRPARTASNWSASCCSGGHRVHRRLQPLRGQAHLHPQRASVSEQRRRAHFARARAAWPNRGPGATSRARGSGTSA